MTKDANDSFRIPSGPTIVAFLILLILEVVGRRIGRERRGGGERVRLAWQEKGGRVILGSLDRQERALKGNGSKDEAGWSKSLTKWSFYE